MPETNGAKAPTALKAFNNFFLSSILGLRVFDDADRCVGRIDDVEVDPRSHPQHPAVHRFLVRGARRAYHYLEPDRFGEFTFDSFQLLPGVHLAAAPPPDRDLPGPFIYLSRDILDKQVVDIAGIKLVRVNDVKLTFVKTGVAVIGVDVGVTGLLRRLSVERPAKAFANLFGRKLNDKVISWEFVEPLGTAGRAIRLHMPQGKIALLHPADIADIMEELSIQQGTELMRQLDDETAAEALAEIDRADLQVSLLEALEAGKAADILENMGPDEAADIIGDMDEAKGREILSGMESDEASEVRELMRYHDDTAGGLMTPEYLAFPETITVEQALADFRIVAPNAEFVYYVYTEDREQRLSGVLTLKDLLLAKPSARLAEIRYPGVIAVWVDAPKDEVAEKMEHYSLLALPVVDAERRIHGVVMLDDVIDVIAADRDRPTHFLKGTAERRRTLTEAAED